MIKELEKEFGNYGWSVEFDDWNYNKITFIIRDWKCIGFQIWDSLLNNTNSFTAKQSLELFDVLYPHYKERIKESIRSQTNNKLVIELKNS